MQKISTLKATKYWNIAEKNFKGLNKWSLCSWTGKLSIVKISVFPVWSVRFKTILIQIPADLLLEIDTMILKFLYRCKGWSLNSWIRCEDLHHRIFFFFCHRIFVIVFQLLSHVQLFVTPWTTAHQAVLSFIVSQSYHTTEYRVQK